MTTTKTLAGAGQELSRHIGYRERGENDTPFNREFGKLPGYPAGGYGYPWCHSFVSVCLKHAGLTPDKDFPWTPGCQTGVAWFKQRGRWGKTPRPGALVYYGPSGGTHVEWVEKVTATHIVTIGGNTSGSLDGQYFNGDGVYRKEVARNSHRIYGYGYPNYEEDDMTKDEVFKAVWYTDKMPVPYGSKTNPEWQPRSVLTDVGQRVRGIEAKLDATNATIKELVTTVGRLAGGAPLDVNDLMRRIETAIEGVTVRLAVDPGAES